MELEEGFRFRPTDYERLCFLLRFIRKLDLVDGGFITTGVDVYGQQEPWEIYHQGVPCGQGDGDDEPSRPRFFITKLKRESEGDRRVNRDVGKGRWKQEDDKGKPVVNDQGKIVGRKKTMYYEINEKKPENEEWQMKEYELVDVILRRFPQECSDYVLCAIKKKGNKDDDASMG